MASVSFISASKLAQLLNTANERAEMYVHVISASRLALGVDPLQPTLTVDLSNEKISPYSSTEPVDIPVQTTVPPSSAAQSLIGNSDHQKLSRRSGSYWFEFKGQRFNCRSLKELLSAALRRLEEARPGTLDKLSAVKPRSKRIVARNRDHLFSQIHLAKDYSEPLMPGWWFGTNNSAPETNAWLKRACVHSGFKWGSDFKTGL